MRSVHPQRGVETTGGDVRRKLLQAPERRHDPAPQPERPGGCRDGDDADRGGGHPGDGALAVGKLGRGGVGDVDAPHRLAAPDEIEGHRPGARRGQLVGDRGAAGGPDVPGAVHDRVVQADPVQGRRVEAVPAAFGRAGEVVRGGDVYGRQGPGDGPRERPDGQGGQQP